jgi:hypothetical protein
LLKEWIPGCIAILSQILVWQAGGYSNGSIQYFSTFQFISSAKICVKLKEGDKIAVWAGECSPKKCPEKLPLEDSNLVLEGRVGKKKVMRAEEIALLILPLKFASKVGILLRYHVIQELPSQLGKW